MALTPEDLDQIRAIVQAVVREAIRQSEEMMEVFVRGVETNLLTVFHGYARGQTARLHTAEVTAASAVPRDAPLFPGGPP